MFTGSNLQQISEEKLKSGSEFLVLSLFCKIEHLLDRILAVDFYVISAQLSYGLIIGQEVTKERIFLKAM